MSIKTSTTAFSEARAMAAVFVMLVVTVVFTFFFAFGNPSIAKADGKKTYSLDFEYDRPDTYNLDFDYDVYEDYYEDYYFEDYYFEDYAYEDYYFEDYYFEDYYEDYYYDYSNSYFDYEDYYYEDYYYDYYDYSYDYYYDYRYRDDRDRDRNEPTCDLDASKTTIDEDEDTTLRWDTRYADRVTLSSFGSVSEDGSRTVSPNRTTTYTLRAEGRGGSDTCSVTIHVEDDHDDDDLWCELDADDRSVEEGDEVTLEWDTRGAVSASINQGIGRVDEDGGEEEVEIEDDDDVTFRMTVRDRDGDEETCSTTVRVDDDDDNDFSSINFDPGPVNNPPVVYLSNLPYTGIEDISPSMLGFYAILAGLLGYLGYAVFLRRKTQV